METGRAGPVATESRRDREASGRVLVAGRDVSGLPPDRAWKDSRLPPDLPSEDSGLPSGLSSDGLPGRALNGFFPGRAPEGGGFPPDLSLADGLEAGRDLCLVAMSECGFAFPGPG